MNEFAIRTENLSCHFGDNRAVEDLSLDVPKGIVFGFLGPNGAGKTTTIRLLLGILEPKQGSAEVLGFDIRFHADQIREHAGALLEHTGLYERLSAEDNLEFYGRINRLPQSERQSRIKELLTHFGLWERRKDRVGNWSRGMKQKLAVSRALLHRPAVIFLDEPTSGLDPVAAASLREDIAALVERDGVTVFLNTHNLPEAEKLCAQVGVIRNGKLLSVGSPDQLRASNHANYVEVSGSGFTQAILEQLRLQPMVESVSQQNSHLEITLSETGDTSTLLGFLVNAGVQVEEVRKNKANLEEVFLQMMEEEPNAK
jgi:ABC-2 type transport system ATP-binding protein